MENNNEKKDIESNQTISESNSDESLEVSVEKTISNEEIESSYNSAITPNKSQQNQFSSVAMTSSRKNLIAVIFIFCICVLVYFVFFHQSSSSSQNNMNGETYNKKAEESKEKIIKNSISLPKVSNVDNDTTVKPLKLPEPLPVSDPTPPAPPPAPVPMTPPTPVIPIDKQPKAPLPPPPIKFTDAGISPIQRSPTQPANPFDTTNDQRQKLLDAKRQAGIMVMGSGRGGNDQSSDNKQDKGSKSSDEQKKSSTSDFLGFGNGALDKETIAKSSAPQVVATKVSNLDRTILQGTIINSILETAINTDIPGTLRAIIARDVYSEAANNILIPKGSRLIGTYESDVKAGQTRVNIIWNRIIRPDGIDIALESSGTDALGRAGVAGSVDNKLVAQLLNAFLISYVIPLGSQEVLGTDGQITNTTTSGGTGGAIGGGTTTTTTGSSKDILLQKAGEEFTNLASEAIKNTTSYKPTITIDQGTIVNIMVQKDLIFPSGLSNGGIVLK